MRFQTAKPRSIDIAEAYLRERHNVGQDRGCLEYRGDLYIWSSGAWNVWDQKELEKDLAHWMKNCEITRFTQNGPVFEPLPFNKTFAQDVAYMVRQTSGIPDHDPIPAYLGSSPDIEPLYGVAFRDAVVDVRDLEARDRNQRHFFPRVLPFDWDPKAECPTWMRCLDEWFGMDPEAQQSKELLARRMGYMLIGFNGIDNLFYDVGKSRGGKGVVDRIEDMLVGDDFREYMRVADMGGDHALQGLHRARTIVFQEVDKGSRTEINRLLGGFVKNVVGHDKLRINPKHVAPFSCRLQAKIKMVGNDVPQIEDSMGSFWRKVVFLVYPNTFIGRENHHLMDELKAELPGIAAWAVKGAQRLLASDPGERWPTAKGAAEELSMAIMASSPIESWLNARCVKGQFVTTEMAFRDYESFRERLNVPAMSKQQFSRALSRSSWAVTSGPRKVGGSSERVYLGIALKKRNERLFED